MTATFLSQTLSLNNGGSSITAPKPAGTSTGDLMLMVAYIGLGVPAPAGWTAIGSYGSSIYWLYRYAQAGDTSWNINCYQYAACYIQILTYTQAATSNPIDGFGTVAVNAPGGGVPFDIAAPSVTTTTPDTTVLHSYHIFGGLGSLSTPSGTTDRSSNGTVKTVDWVKLGAAGATGTKVSVATQYNSGEAIGITVAIKSGNTAPNAPTLTSPINSSTIDRAITQVFSWVFSDPNTGNLQSAYSLRYRLVGTAPWTTVTGGASQSHSFAGGTFAAGDYEWQVSTTDNGGLVGPYSSSGLFSAVNAPATPGIYDPANNGPVNSNPYVIKWTTPAQDAFQVRTLLDAAGSPGAVIQTSIVVENPSAREFGMSFDVNSRVEHVQVRVRVGTLWSAWASNKVNVSYTESQPGVLTLTPEPDEGRVKCEFVPPIAGPGEPLIIYNDLLRKVNGTVDSIVIQRDLPVSFTYYDYNASAEIAWEYQVRSYADNNTTVFSVPKVISPLTLKGSWIHVADEGPDSAINFPYNDNAGDEDYDIEKGLFKVAGSGSPFVEFGEQWDHSITVRFFLTSAQLGPFLMLMRSGKVLCYRDFYGRKIFCVPEASPVQRTRDGGWSTVKFTEVDYQEAL